MSIHSCAGTNWDKCFGFVVAHDGRTAHPESLRGHPVDEEGRRVRHRPASSSGLSPQLSREAKGVIGKWDVPVSGGVHECVKAAIPTSLFALSSSRLIS
jgi:hypothetical protein